MMKAIKSETGAFREILLKTTFKTILILGMVFLILPSIAGNQAPGSEEERLTLLFIGDIMGHDTQIRAAWNPETKSYNYDDQFRYVRPIIESCDFTAANLEVTLAGPPYRGYPQFSSPPALAAACMNAGIECLFTANNHTADRGNRGILNTISRLDSMGIIYTGIFRDRISADTLQPLIINKNGFSLAFLNYTYGTNGIPVPPPVVVNMLDKDRIAADIEKARSLRPDLIVLALHWGVEYDTIPSEEQTNLANYFFYKGADLIIGSHPHVLQKMVWKKDNPVFRNKAIVYSLGNFVSNQRKPLTDGGSMVRIEVARRDSSVVITDAGYFLTWVYTPVEDGKRQFYILPCSEFENRPDFFHDRNDFLQMQRFINTSRSLLNRHNEGFRELYGKEAE